MSVTPATMASGGCALGVVDCRPELYDVTWGTALIRSPKSGAIFSSVRLSRPATFCRRPFPGWRCGSAIMQRQRMPVPSSAGGTTARRRSENSSWPPTNWVQRPPSVPIRVWPPGCLCQAVRDRRNERFAPDARWLGRWKCRDGHGPVKKSSGSVDSLEIRLAWKYMASFLLSRCTAPVSDKRAAKNVGDLIMAGRFSVMLPPVQPRFCRECSSLPRLRFGRRKQ